MYAPRSLILRGEARAIRSMVRVPELLLVTDR
jgi:hypothetical protein